MGKKSKRKQNKTNTSTKGKLAALKSFETENDIGYIRDPVIDDIIKESRDLCPEAKEFYSVTREIFDRELWDEIQTYWLQPGSSSVPKEVAWKLVQQVKLESLKTKDMTEKPVVEHKDVESAQELELLYSVPYQYTEKEEQYSKGPQRHHQYWSVRWVDLIPGYNSTVFGSITCAPFFQDPPIESDEDEYKFRPGCNLRDHVDNPNGLECIRLGVGLTAKDLTVKDVARCLIPTIGILGKYHPGNRSSILQRTMLRFERQVRTWNDGDASDPNGSADWWEISDTMHRRGGTLTHPTVIAALKRENRWLAEDTVQSRLTPGRDLTLPMGAVDVCQYRDDDGYQFRCVRLEDGTEYSMRTDAKKANEGSARNRMTALLAVGLFHKMSPEEIVEKVNPQKK
jgi:hypothetical protein